MKNKLETLFLGVLTFGLSGGLSGCGETAPSQDVQIPQTMQCVNDITALDIRENDKARTVKTDIFLADVLRGKTTIGYGPAIRPKAEITILDGTYYLTRPEGNGTQTDNEPEPDGQGAVFLVHASPKAWKDGGTLSAIQDLNELSHAIGTHAVQMGCVDAALFPFKITGRANTLTWSITGAPKGMKGNLDNVDIIIIGVYDNGDISKNAIIKDLKIHPHVVIKSANISGHLNAVKLDEGATLFVPQKVEK